MPVADTHRSVVDHGEAVAHGGLGAYEQAKECALRARDARPQDQGIATTLGTIFWQLGQYREVRELFEEVREFASDSFGAALNLARGEIAAVRPVEALRLLRELRDQHADDVQLAFDMGTAHLISAVACQKESATRTEQLLFASALDMCIGALDKCLNPKDGIAGEAHFNLGLAHYLNEGHEMAVRHFQKAARLLPEDYETSFCVGTVLAQAAQKVQQRHGAAFGELVLRAAQLLRQARKHLRQAAEESQAVADVFCNLGLVCYQLGDHEGAIKAFRRVLQAEPGAVANSNLALVYAKLGHEAHRHAEFGFWLPDVRRRTLRERARGLLSTALHYFAAALRYEGTNPVLHCNAGLAYMLRNRGPDVERALDHWQLMRQAGGEWAEQRFERLMQFVDDRQGVKVEFMDVGMAVRPIHVPEFMLGLPPLVGELSYVVEPVMDRGEWELEAVDPSVQSAVRARSRVTDLHQRLRALAL